MHFFAKYGSYPHLTSDLTEQQAIIGNLDIKEHVRRLHGIHFLIKAEIVFP
jgi:hypothetical protein